MGAEAEPAIHSSISWTLTTLKNIVSSTTECYRPRTRGYQKAGSLQGLGRMRERCLMLCVERNTLLLFIAGVVAK